jgi:hypothetical protein
MDREQLTALRDAIDTVLTWPDNVRSEIARWLTTETAKPNGRDPHPLPLASMGNGSETEQFAPHRSPTPCRQGAPRQAEPGESGRAAAASDGDALQPRSIRECAGQRRGEQQERDRRKTATIGAARRGHEGHDRSMEIEGRGAGATAGERRPGPFSAVAELTTAAAENDRVEAEPARVHEPWIRSIACYQRRETTEIHGRATVNVLT